MMKKEERNSGLPSVDDNSKFLSNWKEQSVWQIKNNYYLTMSLPYDLITLWFDYKTENPQNRQQLLVPRRSLFGFLYISFTKDFWINKTDETSIILIFNWIFFDFSWMCEPEWNVFQPSSVISLAVHLKYC